MRNKKNLGIFLLSQTTNLVFLIALAIEDFWDGLHNPILRHWTMALLVLVILGNVVSLVYLLRKKYGDAGGPNPRDDR